ncbi:PP2C family protein-serine/threonine phosphatase [Nocardioides mesophilus]|uniref:SpoIIE family protein phosphatase n=1 Tax=Nocardioides mesophilus TaxID=433659 RepID=A0A7G9RCS3_9ACTN|nr:SpoIIE family protein phosphatase [Nocardioides mesophilus]QNN53398.1 SpoIIE family protein phosphatase [Nocardioides mesophilus]
MDESRLPSTLARGQHAAHADNVVGLGPASADFSRALDVELVASLNVRRTTLRLLDLARTRVADWAVVVLDVPRSRTLHLSGGTDPRFTTSVRSSGPVEEFRRLLGIGSPAAPLPEPGAVVRLLPEERLRSEAAALPADVLVFPLHARGDTIGALLLGRSIQRPLTEAEVALAEQLAERAAVALDSAMIYEDLSRVTRVLEDSLRPPHLPQSPSLDVAAAFRPAAAHLDIGGDFYDVHGEEGDWLVVLGDVCGKGVEAAVLNGRARQSIRTAARFDRRPGKLLGTLNEVLYEDDSDRFVTVACCRVRSHGLHPGHVSVDLAVAGHPAPLVVRADGSVEQPDVRGRLAGAMRHDDAYLEVTLPLAPGDALVLYSDGVYEARGAQGFYGMDRMRQVLAPYGGAGAAALCEALERDVVEHLDGHGHDDLTVVVVAPRDPAGHLVTTW